MRTQYNLPAGIIALVLGAIFMSACSWQVPENVNFRGSPQVAAPLGSAEFDFDDLVNVTELTADFSEALSSTDGFTSAGIREDTDPITIDALRSFSTADIALWPTVDVISPVSFVLPTIGPLDISDIFGPFPSGVDFRTVPLTVEISDDFVGDILVELEAKYTDQDGVEQTVEVDPAEGVDPSSDENSFEIKDVVNARPSDLRLLLNVTVTVGNAQVIDSINITLTLPFAFTAEPGTVLDLGDGEDEEDFVFDDDIFGRDPDDPDEGLNDFIDSLRGSNATVSLSIENTVGFTPIIRLLAGQGSANEDLEIFKTGEPDQSGSFDLNVEIEPEDFNGMINSNPFYPKFEFLLPEEFQLNNGGVLDILSGYVRIEASMDYTFTFDQEDE